MSVGPWYCDTCGDEVSDIGSAPGSGYVIWDSGRGADPRNFRIIHKARCDDTSATGSAELSQFLGVDGLNYILSFLSVGPLKLGGDLSGTSANVGAQDQFVDFVRRVQLPGYEDARRRFDQPDVIDRLADANEYYPYLQDILRSISRV